MRVFNKTKNRTIAEEAIIAGTLEEKSAGLTKYAFPRAMYFETRFGAHTFGMRFPIDVAVLDGKGVVRALKKNMAAGRFFFWNPLWKRVLELPAGSGVEIGDELELTE